jgi:hypothetical protein
MLRKLPLTSILVLCLATATQADTRARDSFYAYAQKQAAFLSESGESRDIARVRQRLNEKLSQHKLRGDIRVLLEPQRKQAGIRVDVSTFVIVIVAEHGIIIHSELVER